MKMVAASRLRKAEERANAIKPFADRLQAFLANIAVDPDNIPSNLTEVRRSIDSVGVLVMTSDKGLCGSFNSNVLRKAGEWIRAQQSQGRKVKVFIAGKKGLSYFKRMPNVEIVETYLNLDQSLNYKEIKNMVDRAVKAFEYAEVDEFHIVYMKYKSAAVSIPTEEKLLPIVADKCEGDKCDTRADFLIEPSPEAVLGILFPKFIYTKIAMSLAQSFASEQGQRMVAMTNATENARELVDSLVLKYNKARQSAITNEILEVVSGAEALEG